MIAGLDTSVVVRLLAGEPEDLALAALLDLNRRLRAGQRVLVSDWVLAETYYAFQHHYRASKEETLAALRSFVGTSGVECTAEATEVLATPRLASAQPGFVDRLLHRDYLRAGAQEMVTFERAARRLPGVCVLSSAGT